MPIGPRAEGALVPIREDGRGIALDSAPEAGAAVEPGRGIPERMGMPDPALEVRLPSMLRVCEV